MGRIRRLSTALVVGLLLGGWGSATPYAQPFSAQIQRALNAFVNAPHTWTALQTFSGGTASAGPVAGPASGTCATPTFTFTGDTDTGLGWLGANHIGLCADGATRASVSTTAITLKSSLAFGWSPGVPETDGIDLTLYRDNQDVLGLRRTTNEQQFNIYGSYTSATAHSKLYLRADESDGSAYVLTENGSVSGTELELGIGTADDKAITFRVGANSRWTIGTSATGYALTPTSGASYNLASKFAINTAPSVPVACTSPTVTWSNGTATFQIDVGTSCTGVSTLAVTMPAMTNGYQCTARNLTTATAAPEQSAGTTTSVTFTNYVRTTGLAGDWVDGDDVRISCSGG